MNFLGPQHFRHKGTTDMTQRYASQVTTLSAADSVSANILYATPLDNGAGGAIDQLGLYVGSGLTSFYAALYDCIDDLHGNVYPNALLVSVNVTSVTAGAFNMLTASYTLPASRLLYSVMLASAAGSVYSAGPHFPHLGWQVGTTNINSGTCFQASQTYASGLPSTFPTGLTADSSKRPSVVFRLS